MDVASPPTGTVTFLFSDIESSTRLWEDDAQSMTEALAAHDQILRDTLSLHGGVIFASGGDGFAVAFQRAGDAIAAAVLAQRRLVAHPWELASPMRVRMAVHSGEAVEREGNYFGPPVNRTARLLGLARGGQIVCSETTASLLGDATDVSFVDLGPRTLRGVLGTVRVCGVVAEGLEPFPADASRGVAGNLPRLSTPFVGRADEVKRLKELLGECRIITLVGTGGVGKTRLAVEIGERLTDEFPDGVWVVELAPVNDSDAVAHALSSALGIPATVGQHVEDAIVEWSRQRKALLVVDNCEHVVEGVAALVGQMVDNSSRVVVLATSREPLGLPGEHVWRVQALDPVLEGPELFESCIRRLDAGADDRVLDRDIVVSICQRLDGIPLAIELAAGRATTLSPADLLDRLSGGLGLLKGRGRGRAARHETLEATVAWSYRLLTADEQQLFDWCSVFVDGFDLDALETLDPLSHLDIATCLAGLVDKSMVVVDRQVDNTRYRVLETLRQFGQDRLAERELLTPARDEHLAWSMRRAERYRDLAASPAESESVAGFDREWANFRAAFDWAISSAQLEPAAALIEATGNFAVSRYRRDHADWVRLALARADEEMPQVRGFAAMWAHFLGDPEQAASIARETIDRAADDPHGPTTFWAWFAWHFAAFSTGRMEEAARAADSCLVAATDRALQGMLALVCQSQIAIANGDAPALAAVIDDMEPFVDTMANDTARAFFAGEQAMLRFLQGDRPGAVSLLQQAADHARSVGSVTLTNGWQTGLAMVLSATDHDDTARMAYAKVIRQCVDDDDLTNLWTVLEGLAVHLVNNDLLEAAAVLFGALESGGRAAGDYAVQRAVATERLSANPDGERWLERGRKLSVGEACDYAMAVLAEPATA